MSASQWNGVKYVLAYLAACIFSALTELSVQLASDLPIEVRPILREFIKTSVDLAPFFLVALGLPKLGREEISSLVSRLGPVQAKEALDVALHGVPEDGYDDDRPLSTSAWPVLHDDPTCNMVAFFSHIPPGAIEVLDDPGDVVHGSGMPFKANELIVCDACGKKLVGASSDGRLWVARSA